ncbi:DUF2125 domain-containing protein [Pseudoroseicyclus sp. H15]
MPANRFIFTAASLTAMIAGGAAFADVTGEDVWAQWQDAASSYGEGMTMTGDASRDGDTLVVSNVSVSVENDEMAMSSDIGEISFAENGDGTVSITMPESYEVVFSQMDSEAANRATLQVSNSGLDLQASGSPEDITYTFSADSYGIELTELQDEGEVQPAEAMVEIQGLSGTAGMSGAEELRTSSAEINADAIDFMLDINAPGEMVSNFSGKIQDLAMTQTATTPADMDMESDDPEMFLTAGGSIDMSVEAGESAVVFAYDDGSDSASGAYSAGGSSFGLTVNSDEFVLSESGTDIALQVQTAQFPFPINVTLAELGLNIDMPLAATEEPVDLGAGLTIDQLTLNEELWSMADPSGALPHEPATLIVKLSGSGMLDQDLAEQMGGMGQDGLPGELYELNLDELTLNLIGAAISGSGNFTFDNNDLTTFDGMPRPEGEATFRIDGANALLGKLADMGLVPQDQLMGARMMLGLFAESVGDDSLQSTITVTGDGSVLANGQQLR